MLNEALIMVVGAIMITMTGIMDPGLKKDSFGWLCIAVFSLMVGANIAFMVREKVRAFRKKK
jgi:hypothetical protein